MFGAYFMPVQAAGLSFRALLIRFRFCHCGCHALIQWRPGFTVIVAFPDTTPRQREVHVTGVLRVNQNGMQNGAIWRTGLGIFCSLRIIRMLLSFEPSSKGTDISGALEYLGRLHYKKSVVFLVSDFLDSGYQEPMQVIARRHDLIAVSVRDPGEMRLPDAGLVALVDAENGKRVVVDSSCPPVQKAFAQRALERQRKLAESFASMEIDHIPVECGDDYLRDLIIFFRQRERKQSGEYAR